MFCLGFNLGSSLGCCRKRALKAPQIPPATVHSLGSCQEAQALISDLTLHSGEIYFSLNLNLQLQSYTREHFISVQLMFCNGKGGLTRSQIILSFLL